MVRKITDTQRVAYAHRTARLEQKRLKAAVGDEARSRAYVIYVKAVEKIVKLKAEISEKGENEDGE